MTNAEAGGQADLSIKSRRHSIQGDARWEPGPSLGQVCRSFA